MKLQIMIVFLLIWATGSISNAFYQDTPLCTSAATVTGIQANSQFFILKAIHNNNVVNRLKQTVTFVRAIRADGPMSKGELIESVHSPETSCYRNVKSGEISCVNSSRNTSCD